MSDHNAESLATLRVNDSAIANLAYDVYGKPASDEQIERTKKALEAKTHKVSVVNTKQEAVELLAKAIPAGASVMNAASRTLVIMNFEGHINLVKNILPILKISGFNFSFNT